MAKLPNRLVIEMTNTDKFDELGCPVVGFESKDYAECIIEELEKIKTEIESKQEESNIKDEEGCVDEGITYAYNVGIADCLEIIDKHIKEINNECI